MPDVLRRPPLVQGVQPGEVLVLGQAYLPMLAREVGEIPFAAEVLFHHFHGSASVHSLLHVRPINIVAGGFSALLIQPDGTAGGLAAMFDDRQPVLPAKPV